MFMSTRIDDFVTRFEVANDEMIAIIEGCNEEQLRTKTIAEGWTVAATAYHVATIYPGFASIVERYARGETYSPSATMDEIDAENAIQSQKNANVSKQDVLNSLRNNGELIVIALKTVPEEHLAGPAGVYMGNEFTVEQVLDYVIVGHTAHHLASLQETLEGEAG